jgi:hypothetical protein
MKRQYLKMKSSVIFLELWAFLLIFNGRLTDEFESAEKLKTTAINEAIPGRNQ